MKIEVLHYRDSDMGCDIQVFADGIPRPDVLVFSLDPGAGYAEDDLRESAAAQMAELSEPARLMAKMMLEDAMQSPYVERNDAS